MVFLIFWCRFCKCKVIMFPCLISQLPIVIMKELFWKTTCWSGPGSIHSFVHLQSTWAGWLFTGNLSSQAELAELVNFLGVVFVVLYGCFLELGHP